MNDWTRLLGSILPSVDRDGIPHCTGATCPVFERGHCRVMGGPPAAICEPKLATQAAGDAGELHSANVALRAQVRRLEGELAGRDTDRATAPVAQRVEDRVTLRRQCPACGGWGRQGRAMCEACGGGGELAGEDPEPAPVVCVKCGGSKVLGVGAFYQVIHCGDCVDRARFAPTR